MSYSISLNSSYANQEFDVQIDGLDKEIHVKLHTAFDVTYMSVTVDNEPLGETGDDTVGFPFLCFPNQKVIPYAYMQEKLGGNFVFVTEDDNFPNYENFGTTCNLYFVTLDEMNEE